MVNSSVVARLNEARDLLAIAHTFAKHDPNARVAVAVSGLWGSSVAAVAAALRAQTGRPVAIVCGHMDESDDLADDFELFDSKRPQVVPAIEVSSGLGQASEEQVADRLKLVAKLNALKTNKPIAADLPADQPDLVIPIQSLMQAVPAKDELVHLTRTIGPGDMLEPEKLIVWLSDHGYNRIEQCEVPGDFAVRGGIIDIYLPGQFPDATGQAMLQAGMPVRIDFFGDQIESIKSFDLDSLGSGDTIVNLDLYDLVGKGSSSSTSLLNYLHPQTVLVFWAPLEIAEQAKSYLERVPDARNMYPLSAVLKIAGKFDIAELSQFEQGSSGAIPSLLGTGQTTNFVMPVKSLTRFETDTKRAIKELAELSNSHDVVVFAENDGERSRFIELLDQDAPGSSSRIEIATGYLHRGFLFEAEDEKPLLLVGHHELFHRYEMRRRVTRKVTVKSKTIDSFLDLQAGDYVVHVAHGIAKFTGIHSVSKDGRTEEYLTLRFAEEAVLHVPASRINLIQKYVGGFSGHPNLSRLGSGAWEKQKAKVSEAVMDMAAELLEVQAARRAETGQAFPPDTTWQKEFENAFRYQPTVDQVTSAVEIKNDMQQPRPMDRLLCGDVGYGKTELAMRAAFKAVEYGKQVAVLVPTTILAEQHERSFRERFADYPFAIESVSRFKSTKHAKEVLKRAEKGEVDILVGTHRLLSKDVKFSDLGLVIVDEEQRFGVTHKERLKQMRTTVDVLTMSATPIPRTLHMGMVGLRDISSLTTPPQDRRSIVTEVMAYDPSRVKMALQRELSREGQVYYVHNRVYDILETAAKIQSLVPDARIIVGHGQMEEGELEQVMLKFIRHEADILVATTIIESGLDIPNANTMLIDNADHFGLSELHQLRGRVGRYKHRAYCYMLLPADRPVTPVAAKRLKAIEEFSHLGAGFKIAMRDLELRGAGNILGPEQSGHIATVGYELYCQLLEEATHQLKTGKKMAKPEAHVDLGITAFIPKQYIPADRQRMDVYRRITRCGSLTDVGDLTKDVTDAFGEPPRQVLVLLALTELRLLAGEFGIGSIMKKTPDIVLGVIDAARAERALKGAPGRLSVIDEKTVYLRMPPTFLEGEAALLTLRNLLRTAYDNEELAKAKDVPLEAVTME